MNKIFTILLLSISLYISAQAPANYYTSAVGSTEATLKTKLCAIVGPHTQRTYANLWTDFKTTDKRPDGKVCDIYSNTTNYVFITNQCGNYSGEGSCYNREHSFPKSWFGISSGQEDSAPMGTDLFHLYPSDGYVNGRRGNDPFGEVGTTTYTSNNSYSKLGTCSFPGYTGQVFEPADSLKGDLARSYFYMVTAYDDKVSTWVSPQLASNQYPALSTWSVALFLKWNAQDPVGPKERNRNNAIYSLQKNRNPFIDHPELAEYIWGAKKGELWSLTAGVKELKIEFSISPNPAQNELNITSDEPDLSYTIFNLNGQALSHSALTISHSIPVSQLSNGMYLLQLSADKRKSIQKFIINANQE